MQVDDGHGLEMLSRDECLRLLALTTLGRVGFTQGALPTVLPVAFRMDGERILVRTVRGGTLAGALRNAVVAFEVDDVDPVRHSGWSVSVTGVATEVEDLAPADLPTAVAEDPAADGPAADDPLADDPAADDPAADSPAADSPAADSPAADSPAADSPAADSIVLAISTELLSGRRVVPG